MINSKIIPHTADIRLKVEGSTLKELFWAACEGMTKILKGDGEKKINKTVLTEEIIINSPYITALLIDFLSELLTKSFLNNAVFDKVEFRELTDTSLKAKIIGTKVEKFAKDIKAVTYHEANVIKNKKGNFETMIVFDI